MYWTSEIASVLGSAPWKGGITKDELIDYAERNNASPLLLEDLRALEDDGESFYGLEDLVGDVPTADYYAPEKSIILSPGQSECR